MSATTAKKPSLTVKAKKGNGKVISQTLTSPDQKKRWAEMLEKNGYRVITGGRI